MYTVGDSLAAGPLGCIAVLLTETKIYVAVTCIIVGNRAALIIIIVRNRR